MMITAIRSFAFVPAAGKSARMGRSKLLLPWGDSTLIEHLLAVWSASGVTKTIVIVDATNEPLVACVRRAPVDVVVAAEPPPEMKDSVLYGIRHVAVTYQPNSQDVWLLAPADMPTLSVDVIQSLIAAHDPQKPAILVPICRGRQGHPVLIPWRFAENVSRLASDQGINTLVKRGPMRTIEFDERAIPADIDTPEDYERQR